MGTDIHDWAEVRRGGKWEEVGEVFVNPYHDPAKYKPGNNPQDDWDRPLTRHPLHTRQYLSFTVLAGVRSRDDREDIPCISDKRGYPPDVTDGLRVVREDYGDDGHDNGWATLRELITYPWHAANEWADRTYNKAADRQQGNPWTWLESETVPQLFGLITCDPLAVQMFRDAMRGDGLSLAALEDWLKEQNLPGLDDVRMVFFFDN